MIELRYLCWKCPIWNLGLSCNVLMEFSKKPWDLCARLFLKLHLRSIFRGLTFSRQKCSCQLPPRPTLLSLSLSSWLALKSIELIGWRLRSRRKEGRKEGREYWVEFANEAKTSKAEFVRRQAVTLRRYYSRIREPWIPWALGSAVVLYSTPVYSLAHKSTQGRWIDADQTSIKRGV